MTADLLDHWTITGARRWVASLAVVLALHIAVALVILFHRVPMAPENPPQPPILMDLAPLPAAPMNLHPLPVAPSQSQPSPTIPQAQPEVQRQTQPQVQQPAQPQTQTQSQMQQPVQPVSPPTPPAPQPETTSPLLPSTTQAAEPRIIVPPPPEVAETPPAPAKPAVKSPPIQTASVPSVPALPMPDAQENSLSAWQRKVIARLYSLNRLPPGMPADEAAATVDVLINVNRQGHIVYFKIVRPSGFPTLDHAVRSLMRHADPLPAPPPPAIDLYDQPQSFVLTIGYYNVPIN